MCYESVKRRLLLVSSYYTNTVLFTLGSVNVNVFDKFLIKSDFK